MNQDQGRHDVFVGIDHRLKRVQRKDTFNQMWKEGYKVAVDEVRSTCEEIDCLSRTWERVVAVTCRVVTEARCEERSRGTPLRWFNDGLGKMKERLRASKVQNALLGLQGSTALGNIL